MDDRDRIMKEQVRYPEVFDQNELIKFNYEYDTELPIVDKEVRTGINGASAKFNAMDNEQPKAMPN